MNFWDLCGAADAYALIGPSAGETRTYAELDREVSHLAHTLRRQGSQQLGFLPFRTSRAHVCLYLACLRAGHVPLLLPPAMDHVQFEMLRERFRPNWIATDSAAIESQHCAGAALHPDLALLMSTSGSTGSAKLVRLSRAALQANALSIRSYLSIAPSDRAITTLPLHYSYGLSVLNSHLLAGASAVLTEASVITPAFRALAREASVTSLAGVPYTWLLLQRTGFSAAELPTLRTMTQAGGRLDERGTRWTMQLAEQARARMFVMYGQTEATARISYVPPEQLAGKIGSIGVAIPGGELSIDNATSELVYRGPNVMMGYADSPADLARGDDLQGVLLTGELARRDSDGFHYLTGRLKRFIKLGGTRIGLDELESLLQEELAVPVSVGGRDDLLVACVESADASAAARAKLVLQRIGVHHSLCRISCVADLPLLANGKKDYQALMGAL